MEFTSDETTKRALACEAAIANLVMRLVESKVVPTADALKLLRPLSLSGELSTVRLAGTIKKLERLRAEEGSGAKA